MTPRKTARPRKAGLNRRSAAALLFCAGLAGAALAGGTPALAGQAVQQSSHATLPRPDSLRALQAQSAAARRPVVALFSTKGCAWCDALRRDQLRHLARDAEQRGVLVVEFDLADRRAFRDAGAASGTGTPAGGWSAAASPAELGRLLGVRVAPTLAFLAPAGEAASPLVGYTSPDFYGAYLDDRIEQARAALQAR